MNLKKLMIVLEIPPKSINYALFAAITELELIAFKVKKNP